MRKVWLSTRKDGKGYNVQWYEGYHRRTKFFSHANKRFARKFMAAKFIELNSDCRLPGETFDMPWDSVVSDYARTKEIKGRDRDYIAYIFKTLGRVQKHTGITYTHQLRQQQLDSYILWRRGSVGEHAASPKQISTRTLNSEITVIAGFLRYGMDRGCIAHGLKVSKVKQLGKVPRCLTSQELARILSVCSRRQVWRMRILLLAVTGLRVGDVDRLRVADFDIAAKTVSKVESKTGKVAVLPLPDAVMPEIHRYLLDHVKPGSELLLGTRACWKAWQKILKAAKVEHATMHDLRKTYASMQIAAGTPMPVVQRLLNHSSILTTAKHYIAVNDQQTRDSVNRLEVLAWLRNSEETTA